MMALLGPAYLHKRSTQGVVLIDQHSIVSHNNRIVESNSLRVLERGVWWWSICFVRCYLDDNYVMLRRHVVSKTSKPIESAIWSLGTLIELTTNDDWCWSSSFKHLNSCSRNLKISERLAFLVDLVSNHNILQGTFNIGHWFVRANFAHHTAWGILGNRR